MFGSLRNGFLKRGDIIVCDNWSGYVGKNSGERLREELLHKFQILVYPIPAYSPELNAIELIWNQLKLYLRHHERVSSDEEALLLVINWLNSLQMEVVTKSIMHVYNYITTFLK